MPEYWSWYVLSKLRPPSLEPPVSPLSGRSLPIIGGVLELADFESPSLPFAPAARAPAPARPAAAAPAFFSPDQPLPGVERLEW